jgi:hypothetical protein
MRFKWIALAAIICSVVAATSTAAAAPPAKLAAKAASGFIPSRHANNAKIRTGQLQYHSGPVMHATTVIPIFWGSNWSTAGFVSDKITGLDFFYSHVGGSSYSHTNSEYTDGSGHVNTTSISKGTDLRDSSTTPVAPPSTNQVLQEIAKMTGNHPVANAYYPVYSGRGRGTANYCAWHSSGTINGIRVQFGFFFTLDNDFGCDPGAPGSTGHSQGLSALANVSGHELSEMLTDPQLNAWYDQQGNENADKCAWTFSGLVSIGGQSWKIQGNWSNAAANAGTGYANRGCIETS